MQKSFSGRASYYGNEAGKRTASGERYNQHDLTAAHRTLPFGTRLRVTHGNRSIIVRVSDRGPFIRNRIIDLSKGAAAQLGMIHKGIAHVYVEVLN